MTLFGDWRDVRAALDLAVADVDGAKPQSHDQRDWKIAAAVVANFRAAQAFVCAECQKPLPYGQEIRCLDCKAALCEGCAPRHFWPNGRPARARS